ncbi:hypothetical protein MPTA5024_21710, partial [Microbispora sp. ATCC PTA-5024]
MAVRLGYDPGQVDELIRRIERTLASGPAAERPITPNEIREAKFGVKLGGYNETAVDFALDAFIVALEARAAGSGAPAAKEGPAVPKARTGSGAPAAAEDPAVAEDPAAPNRPSGSKAPADLATTDVLVAGGPATPHPAATPHP